MIMTGCHPCNIKTNNKQSLSTTNLLLLDISWSTLTMSNNENQIIMERLYEEALAKGLSPQAAMKYANEEFQKLPQP